jgi:amino acid adenylation domain-containing protein
MPRAYPAACVHELIVDRARAVPSRVAVEMTGARLTYGELEERSGRLADHLRGLGVGPNVVVGIYMERSLDMLVGLLAILRAGGAYVPLDPAYPQDRLAYMLEDSGAQVLVTQQALSGSLGGDRLRVVCVDGDWGAVEAGAVKVGALGPEDIAYVIYTSGSTGKPKGVAVTHRSLVNLLESMGDEPGLGESDVLLSVTTLSFDIAGLELYLPLLKGARLVLLTRDEAGDGRILRERLAATGATVLQATPATWRLLLESGWAGTTGLKVLCGGEALPRDLANELAKRASEVWNVYGPTETTIWSSLCRIREGEGAVSIGHPVANTALYVLDKAMNQLPVGVPGELFIGGDGLARGYWNRPDLTAERFLPDPHSERKGARMYRTGDLVRRLGDGTIECLGRLDHQVKVRGFRIELGEIEAHLARHPAVRAVAATVYEATPEDRRIAVYLAGSPVDSSELRRFLAVSLPEPMLPSVWIWLDALPLTPNGKLDRKALPRPEIDRRDLTAAFVGPRTELERTLAAAWGEVLRMEVVGIHDNFFELGGHSLLATRVVSRVRDAFSIDLPIRSLFELPTVAGLAGI